MSIRHRRQARMAEAEASLQGHTKAPASSQGVHILKQYVITVVLACIFWVVAQQLYKHAGHLARP
jgi:hypothetical protein